MSIGVWAVVPAAGVGRRMGSEIPKQYLPLNGRPVLEHSIERLLGHPLIRKVFIALSEADNWWDAMCFAADPRVVRVTGGAQRCHSVLNALYRLEREAAPRDWVLVHDAARPCLRTADIQLLFERLKNHPVGGILAGRLHDTIKRADADQAVTETLHREHLWRAFTPQMFRLQQLKTSLENALAAGQLVTDEASAIEWAGLKPLLVEGHGDNIKITRPQDLQLASFFLEQQQDAELEVSNGEEF